MSMKFKKTDGSEAGEAVAIKEYFGVRPGDNTTGFMNEVKALSPADKTELAIGAAKALGWTPIPEAAS